MVCSFNQHLKEVGHQKRLGVTLLERLRRTSFHVHVIYSSGPQPFWHQGTVLWKTILPRTRERGWFQDDSSTLRSLRTLLLLLLYQLHLRASGIRSQRLGNPWFIAWLFFFFLRREDFREGTLCALWTHLALTSLGQPGHENRSSQKTPRLVPHIWRKATCDSPPKCFHSMWFLLKASPSSPCNEAEKKLHSIPATRGARMEEGVPLLQRWLQSQESPGGTLQLSGPSACSLTSPLFLNPQKPVCRGRTCL